VIIDNIACAPPPNRPIGSSLGSAINVYGPRERTRVPQAWFIICTTDESRSTTANFKHGEQNAILLCEGRRGGSFARRASKAGFTTWQAVRARSFNELSISKTNVSAQFSAGLHR